MLETRAVYRLADEAYRPFSCPASGECCQLSTTKREPWLWRNEWLVLEAAGRAKNGGSLPPARLDGGCRFLDAAGLRCSVYADRPFGCRTFFCGRKTGPDAEPRELVVALSLRLERVAQALDADAQGPQPLNTWCA